MKNIILKGIIKGLLYYGVGFLLAWVCYLIFGWEYIHAPGLHHLIGFLFLVGGLVFCLYYLILIVTRQREKVNYGFFLVHLTTLSSIIAYMIYSIYSVDKVESQTNPKNILTITKSDSLGNSSIIDGSGDTLYLRNDDTILIDKTEEVYEK